MVTKLVIHFNAHHHLLLVHKKGVRAAAHCSAGQISSSATVVDGANLGLEESNVRRLTTELASLIFIVTIFFAVGSHALSDDCFVVHATSNDGLLVHGHLVLLLKLRLFF